MESAKWSTQQPTRGPVSPRTLLDIGINGCMLPVPVKNTDVELKQIWSKILELPLNIYGHINQFLSSLSPTFITWKIGCLKAVWKMYIKCLAQCLVCNKRLIKVLTPNGNATHLCVVYYIGWFKIYPSEDNHVFLIPNFTNSVNCSFMHYTFNKCLLNTYFVPDTVPYARDTNSICSPYPYGA